MIEDGKAIITFDQQGTYARMASNARRRDNRLVTDGRKGATAAVYAPKEPPKPAKYLHDWRAEAPCLDEDTDLFFDAIWPEAATNVEALEDTRTRFCRTCPFRRQCLEETMEYELMPGFVRAGLFGYLTPGQRHSVNKRGSLRCPNCGTVRDPVLLEQGALHCPKRCGQKDRTVPAIPIDGDQWTKRHTALSRRLVAWIVDNVAVNAKLPTPTQLGIIHDVRKADVVRVLQALVADGTIETRGSVNAPSYWRLAPTATMREWTPRFLSE